MNLFFLFTFSLGLQFCNSVAVDENKEAIIFDLIGRLEIRQCIRIIDHSKVLNLNFFKIFSNKNIQTMFLDKNNFVNHVRTGIFTFWKIGIVMETKSLNVIRDLFHMLKKVGQEQQIIKFTWLVFLKEGGVSDGNEIKLKVPYDCEFIIIYLSGGNVYNLLEVYEIKNVSFLFQYGSWTKHFGLNATGLSFYDRRSDLSNVSILYGTFLLGNKACETQTLACAKREIFFDMQTILKFKIVKIRKIRERSDEDDYADIYDSLTVFHSYFYRFDLFAPLFKTYLNWYIREPGADVEPEFYRYPFATDLWFSILLTIVIGSVSLVIIGFVNNHLEKKSPLLHLIDDIFTTLECYCSQDGGENRNYLSFRVLLITILLNASFLIPAYSAFITSYLSVKIPRLPFYDLEGFIKNGKYTLCRIDEAPFPDLYFKFSTDPMTQVNYKKFLQVYPQSECLSRTCNDKYSIMLPNIYYEEANCTFYQMKTPITFFFLALALKKDSVFRNVLNHFLLRSYTSGITNKLQKWINDKPIGAEKEDDVGFQPISIDQMSHIFRIIPIGVAIGASFFFLEVLIKSKRFQRIRKWKPKYFFKN